MTIVPFAALWACLVVAVIGLAVYRRIIALREDDCIHVAAAEAGNILGQISIAHKLEVVDRWGKILTILAVSSGVVLGAAYLYYLWNQSMVPVG